MSELKIGQLKLSCARSRKTNQWRKINRASEKCGKPSSMHTHISSMHIYKMEFQKERRKGKGQEIYVKKITSKKSWMWLKKKKTNLNLHIQEVQQIPSRIKLRRSTHHNQTVKSQRENNESSNRKNDSHIQRRFNKSNS